MRAFSQRFGRTHDPNLIYPHKNRTDFHKSKRRRTDFQTKTELNARESHVQTNVIAGVFIYKKIDHVIIVKFQHRNGP